MPADTAEEAQRRARILPRLQDARGRLQPLLGDQTLLVALLTAASLGAGLAEAGVLALVAQVAAALVDGGDRLSTDLGPASLDVGIGPALALAAALASIRLALQLVVAWLPARISADVQAKLQTDVFGAFSRASWPTQADDGEGHLQELMASQILRATEAVLHLATFLSSSAMFLALAISAFLLSVPVAAGVMVSALVMVILLRPLNTIGRAAAQRLSQAMMDQAAGVSEAVRLTEEAQVFGTATDHRHKVGGLIEEGRRAFFRYQLAGRMTQNSYQSVIILLIVGGLAGLYLTGAGNLATLGAAILILIRAASQAQCAQAAYHGLCQSIPYLDRLQQAIARYRSSTPADGGSPLPVIRTLAMEGVSFAYTPERPVLGHLAFKVAAGEAIGVVGPSGAGKSTLVQLLLRLRTPTSGRFLVNGEPAERFARTDWQHRVAYVGQDPRVFQGTVADNIRYFRPLDDATVERAARLAHIHGDIVAMPAGYDTVIGQRADAVSGGQRQRICLARALAGEPDVLVLDEPTSALDSESEAAVASSLAELHGRVTMFIIAHRLSTLTTCDRVLVLADGKVEAFDTGAELARTNAYFRRATQLSGQAS
ncbi:MAG: ABC transporter ATP-binding protein [Thermoleophilaceae bacterium]|nr:ABC transporter ATP-binding protein [Thermoleophilaceae bacterium]